MQPAAPRSRPANAGVGLDLVLGTWRAARGRRTTHPLTEGVEPEEARDLVST